MSSSPEERQRLTEIFSTMPNLDKALRQLEPNYKSSEWFAVGRESTMASGSEEFEIGNGKVSFEFKITQYLDFLNWTSDLPGFLRVVNDPSQYQQFLDFFQRSFPDMLYGYVLPENQRPTVVDLSVKRKADSIHFDLGAEKDRAKLLTEFVARPELINSLRIGTMSGEQERPYWFGVNYFQGIPNMGRLGIGLLHSQERGWNERVLGWTISTHAEKDQIGDFGISASNLGDIIHTKMGISAFVPKA